LGRGLRDPDGDGYVEYAPAAPGSLGNQGWKDSHDAVSFAHGRLAEAPIAMAEVQAYTYAAWRAGAALAAADGDDEAAADCHSRADDLQARFERDFWLPDQEAFAIALDHDKRPVDAIASNMGHLLWAGIIADHDKAAAVARWLVSPELFTGWGVRTLATSMARYSPLSYHNGSVWPHDTAICVAGLRTYGFIEEAHRIAGGMFAAAEPLDGRLPELFAGLTIDEVPVPVRYPTSCSPQAWASAAPLLVLRPCSVSSPTSRRGGSRSILRCPRERPHSTSSTCLSPVRVRRSRSTGTPSLCAGCARASHWYAARKRSFAMNPPTRSMNPPAWGWFRVGPSR
jgi:glycogen debranching enzyme